jgi:hypothetical protein
VAVGVGEGVDVGVAVLVTVGEGRSCGLVGTGVASALMVGVDSETTEGLPLLQPARNPPRAAPPQSRNSRLVKRVMPSSPIEEDQIGQSQEAHQKKGGESAN